jgi:adenylate cyclase
VKLKLSFVSSRKARFGVVACTALLLVAATLFGAFGGLDRNAFDLMSTIAAPRPQQPAAVIVAIDEPSFSAIGKPWPWPRDIHARLIRSLKQAGARSIGFDVVFADATTAEADRALAAAADSRTVLAADETLADTPQGTMLVRTEPLLQLALNGARVGVTSVALDSDGVVRRIPRYPDSFARRFLTGADRGANQDRLIQYFGGLRTYPYVSYYQALDPQHFLPAGLFKDHDVIVGLVVQANPEVRQAPDSFETTFTARDGRLVPGVEIQATIIDNLLHHLWIEPVPGWVLFVLLIGGCALGYAVGTAERLPMRVVELLGAAVVIFASAWLLLRFGRVWASPVEPLSGLAVSSLFLGVLDFVAERRRRHQIQDAFGQYVAPDIVRRIIEDPDRVKLGGERKMITVLFADVRGFTTIAEALRSEPETLTRLINEILTCLSEVVTRHCGTIDKYIGDCLMAFWNAPLDDPDHATHAVQAAVEMIERIAVLDEDAHLSELCGTSLSVAIGVGVNSGECVVGNMGSSARFDYTVVGDSVNVASRIQGLSKQYGVPLLIGEATAALTRDCFDYVELDTIRVRGKRAAQVVYSLRNLVSSLRSLDRSGRRVNGSS